MKMAIPLSEETEQVLNNYLKAFVKGDVDAIMENFADDAVLCKHDGILRGKDEIRLFFEGFTKAMPPGSDMQIKQRFIEGALAYLFWSGKSESVKIPFATDTIIIRRRKILKQTFTAQLNKKF